VDWTAIFGAIREFFGFAKQHEALKNTPALQTNKVAGNDAKRVETISRAEDAAAAGDLEPLRKEIAE
jgi:hypothetical protein